MSFTGKVQNGVIVLPPEVKLPDGTEVQVETIRNSAPPSLAERYAASVGAADDPLLAAALKLAKPRPHWPKDYALNHGHYVSGGPKKP